MAQADALLQVGSLRPFERQGEMIGKVEADRQPVSRTVRLSQLVVEEVYVPS